ncbi:hypothetical protein RSP795_10210 [Ralstonia solanacearum]|nr:hypothetical protein RSP795_10210 [Ralstonia solanacearum]
MDPLPANVYPENVMSEALQSQIDQQYRSGELRVQKQVEQQPINPKAGWDLNSFMTYLKGNKAVTPPFQGADVPRGGWFDQASTAIGGTEGFEGRAYHGIYSPQRKPGDIYVKPGQFVEGQKDEVSIGYGWNLSANTNSRSVFRDVLGIPDERYNRIVNGQDALSPAEGARLRDYAIYQANAGLDRMVSKPLSDHQRAALVSMVYNFGPRGFAATGVPEAINKGISDQEVAKLIFNSSPQKKKLASRRAFEANLYLGVAQVAAAGGLNVNELPRR